MRPPHRGLMLMVGSAILWGLGDVGAQAITHYSVSVSDRRAKESEDKDEEFNSFRKKDAEFKIDWFRVCSASVFGIGACIGPPAYYRLKSLQSSMYGLQQSTPSTVLEGLFFRDHAVARISSVLEGLYGTLNIATFFPFMGCLGALNRATFPFEDEGSLWHGPNWSLEQAKEDLKRGLTPALVLGGVMVPAKQIMISRFVPAPYQLHCASLFALVGSCCLSWIELQQHKDDAAGPEDGRRRSKV